MPVGGVPAPYLQKEVELTSDACIGQLMTTKIAREVLKTDTQCWMQYKIVLHCALKVYRYALQAFQRLQLVSLLLWGTTSASSGLAAVSKIASKEELVCERC